MKPYTIIHKPWSEHERRVAGMNRDEFEYTIKQVFWIAIAAIFVTLVICMWKLT